MNRTRPLRNALLVGIMLGLAAAAPAVVDAATPGVDRTSSPDGGMVILAQGSKQGKPAKSAAPKPVRGEPLELRDIRFRLDPDGKEFLYITFNRFYTPTVSTLPGKAPRIVLDVSPVSSVRKGWALIPVDGRLIKRIRTSLDKKKGRARIVLDMEPSKDFAVQPFFSEEDNTYVLEIREEPLKPASQ